MADSLYTTLIPTYIQSNSYHLARLHSTRNIFMNASNQHYKTLEEINGLTKTVV